MIINGGSRSNGGFFARHLMRTDQNDRVAVVEIRGLGATTIADAFREMKAVASGTNCSNYFYHANINTRADELLTGEQWSVAADTLERQLGLHDQPRIVVEHQKDGRTHRHIVWSRIDADSMKAISDSLTYAKHELAARAVEATFGHAPVPSVLVKDRETLRPERNLRDWESLRAGDSGIDPKAIKAELTELWRSADSGSAFAHALAERGYILVRGDRRDFCIIDAAGDDHSLARRLSGVKAAEVRDRLADLDRASLPSVEEGRALARARQETGDGEGADGIAPTAPTDQFAAIHAETVAQLAQAGLIPATPGQKLPVMDDFDAAHRSTIAQAHADTIVSGEDGPDAQPRRFERVRQWWANMREHFTEWRELLQERFDHFLGPWGGDASGQDKGPLL